MLYITTRKRRCYWLLLYSHFLWATPYLCYFEEKTQFFSLNSANASVPRQEQLSFCWFSTTGYRFSWLYVQCLISASEFRLFLPYCKQTQGNPWFLVNVFKHGLRSKENWCDFQKCYTHLGLQRPVSVGKKATKIAKFKCLNFKISALQGTVYLNMYKCLILSISITIKFPNTVQVSSLSFRLSHGLQPSSSVLADEK